MLFPFLLPPTTSHGRRVLLLLALLLVGHRAPAQTAPAGTDYYAALKTHDLSSLWRADRLAFYSFKTVEDFPEPLGFIGSTYQRFYLHYTSVRPDPSNPYVYRVSGKTRVKNNICDFTGTITVLKAGHYPAARTGRSTVPEGEMSCRVELTENRNQPGSGTISGTMATFFYLDAKGVPRYNTINSVSDSWDNNQCEAIWTSYATKKQAVCNWGDYRIPKSGPLDVGAGEFSVSDKYWRNGWENYVAAESGQEDLTPAKRRAQAEEKRPWWK